MRRLPRPFWMGFLLRMRIRASCVSSNGGVLYSDQAISMLVPWRVARQRGKESAGIQTISYAAEALERLLELLQGK